MPGRKRNLYPDKYNQSNILLEWTRLPHLAQQLKDAGIATGWMQKHLFTSDEPLHKPKDMSEVSVINSFDVEV